ncbi:hypothetical protein ACP4OV_013167 [Aristida adscensionis]
MELAAAALGSLLPKLGTLLTEEYKMQKGVRGEIRFLKEEMEQMQAVLSELSKRPAHRISDPDKLWARDLKELSYTGGHGMAFTGGPRARTLRDP